MNIFMSYAYHDRAATERIAAHLETHGYVVWWEFAGIPGGANWAEAIENALALADWVLVLISPASAGSQLVQREIIIAEKLHIPILPIMVAHSPQDDLPLAIKNFNYVDATQDLDFALHVIAEIITQQHAAPRSDAPPPSPAELEAERRRVLESPLPERIFIAYSHHQRPLAEQLAALLTHAGKAVFYDAKIKAGARWRRAIQQALDDATHLVVIWTPDARDSDEVEREVSYALAEGKRIVPLLSQETPKLPYHLHGLHYILLQDDLGMIEDALLNAIAQHSETGGLWT